RLPLPDPPALLLLAGPLRLQRRRRLGQRGAGLGQIRAPRRGALLRLRPRLLQGGVLSLELLEGLLQPLDLLLQRRPRLGLRRGLLGEFLPRLLQRLPLLGVLRLLVAAGGLGALGLVGQLLALVL